MTDADGGDPRKALDDLIASTDEAQWYRALDQIGGPVADERKMDIVEWAILGCRQPISDLERASGLSLDQLPDVTSTDFGAGEHRSKVWNRNRGLLTRIENREKRGQRTNTGDLAAAISQDRAETFGACASAQMAGYLTFGPPDFQWHVTEAGRQFLRPSEPKEDAS